MHLLKQYSQPYLTFLGGSVVFLDRLCLITVGPWRRRWARSPPAPDVGRIGKHFQKALLCELTAFQNEFHQRILLLVFYVTEMHFLRTIY